METLRRALRNVAAQLGSQIVIWMATLLFMAMLGRHLGRDGFGVLLLALSITGLFDTAIDFGIHPLITRELAHDRTSVGQYLVAGVLLKAGPWAVSFIALRAITRALGYSAETRMVITVLALALALSAMASLITAMYRTLEYMGSPVAVTAVEKVATLCLGTILVLRVAGVVAVAWVMLASAAALAV